MMGPAEVVHIAGGTIALATGTAALVYRKGGAKHAWAGTWFFGSMLVLAGTGAALAAPKPDRPTTLVGLITLYLVATSWQAIRSRDGKTGRFEMGAFVFAAACAASGIMFGLWAAASPAGTIDGYPPAICYAFATLAGIAASLDLDVSLRKSITTAQRVARHLWRMCFAPFLAAASLFLGQQDDVFPFMQGSPFLFVPPFATLAVMAYWLTRVRFGSGVASKPKP